MATGENESGHPVTGLAYRSVRAVRDRALESMGGRARARVVLVLASVLALNGADAGTISATANNLESAFHIGNTEIGLLLTVVALVGATFTLPVGVLTDRVNRTEFLGVSITLWAVATVVSGGALSYLWLLLARVGLGAVSATAGPTVASLTGDFFPASDRGRIFGMILAGELAGTGLGFVVSGDISAGTSWRYAFFWLAVPALVLAWVVWRLPEPARGGQSQLSVGDEEIVDEEEVETAGPEQSPEDGDGTAPADQTGLAAQVVRRARVRPQPELVLHSDPTPRSLWWAVRYVLKVRTNVVIIVASSLGYFYFAGLRSFAILYLIGHYGLSKPVASALVLVIGIGAIAGVFVGGRLADRLLRRGHIRGRVLVPAVCLLAITPVLAPAIVTASIALALPLLLLGGFLLGAPNPSMDAARLDIMHPRLWGRAEGVRTVLRTLGEASAPLIFGLVSQYVFGGPHGGLGGASAHYSAGATGLEYTLLLLLVPLIAAGLVALPALRTYPRDVATAAASVEAVKASLAEPEAEDRRPGERNGPGAHLH